MSKILMRDLAYIKEGLSASEKTKFDNSVVLVTGCAGFLGYTFMQFFRLYGEELGIRKVIGLDNFMLGEPGWLAPFRDDPRFELKRFDIIKDSISGVAGAEQTNLIIHMASVASPTFYRQYPIETLDANIWGLRSLLDFYCERNIRGFLFYSSSELYGNPDPAHVPNRPPASANTRKYPPW